ncbi:MAG: cyclic pyranopterin monophosphate synthase MoaC [Planctomycetes bacterium]|nr:cyclic pyranopterin monophosphate synthase MoaC [Planctomycetota bacterium]
MEQNTPPLSHLTESGEARMVDVSQKPIATRTAVASALVTTRPEVIDAIFAGDLPKGDVIGVARIAGIQAAKRTADLIPLCHPMTLEWVDISIEREGEQSLLIRATARTCARTGVEMEAMTAASVAALALYDMTKSADKGIVIGPIRLESKTGGKSGDYQRQGGG